MNEKVNVSAFYKNRLILLNLPLQTIIYLQQQTLLNNNYIFWGSEKNNRLNKMLYGVHYK